ncbi:nad-binding rossmann fold oxidoreductase family protein [Fusarium avenaceum]|nr:nad-binding rossmann fold oxidoreductase family protein [Fusarium avenaceum]
MAPIRVGFIGLSKSGWAPLAHFPYLNASEDYQIVAICNSTIESSKEAVKLYNLPAETRTYGDPEDLAKDKEVDLVVCCVRADRHFPTIAPSLKAGKDVYVEWPLAKSLPEAKEFLRLKNEGGVKKAMVGLQARKAPVIATLKKVIESGKIGDVLSSNWTGYGPNGGPTVTKAFEYMGSRAIGGNLVTIHLGHVVDYVQRVLGYGFQTPPKSLLANRRKTVQLVTADGNVLEENHPKDSDDTIFLNGTLSTGIPLSLTFRGGDPFPGTPGLDWRIYGTKGEIRVTATGTLLSLGYPDVLVEVIENDKTGKEVIEVETDEFDEGEEFGIWARNVARVYKGFSKGEVVCSFEDAVERHALLDGLYRENGYHG